MAIIIICLANQNVTSSSPTSRSWLWKSWATRKQAGNQARWLCLLKFPFGLQCEMISYQGLNILSLDWDYFVLFIYLAFKVTESQSLPSYISNDQSMQCFIFIYQLEQGSYLFHSLPNGRKSFRCRLLIVDCAVCYFVSVAKCFSGW